MEIIKNNYCFSLVTLETGLIKSGDNISNEGNKDCVRSSIFFVFHAI